MNEQVITKITEYVYKNYKSYKDKQLIIREYPLILGKKVLEL